MNLNYGPRFEVSSDIERVRSQSGEAMKGGVSECSFTYGKTLDWRYFQPDYFFQINKNAFMRPNLERAKFGP